MAKLENDNTLVIRRTGKKPVRYKIGDIIPILPFYINEGGAQATHIIKNVKYADIVPFGPKKVILEYEENGKYREKKLLVEQIAKPKE